jgi:peptidoglycan/xylan/chitin deacetylase (PgdA/CDA1 family)
MMTREQIRSLSDAGHTIGSHTVSHPWLSKIDPAQVLDEMRNSKETLEGIIGRAVNWLCYPSGGFNEEIAARAKELGYHGACSVIRDNRQRAGQLYWLPRVMVMNDATPAKLNYYRSGLYHWVHRRKNRKRWSGFA